MAAPTLGLGGPSPGPHRNFLDSISHYIGKTGTGLENIAINSPAGFYHLGGGLIHNPIGTVENIGKQTLTDFEHPLRNPANTLLDTLGLFSGVGAVASRVGEFGRVAAGASKLDTVAGEAVPKATQFRRAALFGAPVPERIISTSAPTASGRVATFEQRGASFSRNPTIRAAQGLLDQLHEAHPELHIPGVFARQTVRQERAARQLVGVDRGLSKAPAAELVAKFGGKKFEPAVHEAIAIVGRGVLPEKQLQYIRQRIASGELRPRSMRNMQKWETRTIQAQKYLDTYVHHTEIGDYQLPKIRDEFAKENEFKNAIQGLTTARENALLESGQLTDKSSVVRKLGPKNIMEGHGLPENIGSLRKSLAGLVRIGRENSDLANTTREKIIAAEAPKLDENGLVEGHIHDPELAAQLFRVPEVMSPAARAVEGFTRGYRGGRIKVPGTLTHQYTGSVLKYGNQRSDLANVVAESYTESVRFLALKQLRQKLMLGARDTPDGIPEEFRLPIVSDYWRGRLPKGYDFPQRKLEEGDLSKQAGKPSEIEAAARWYEPIRQLWFEPSTAYNWIREHTGLTPEQAQTQAIPGIKWVDKRQLGGLDKQNPLWSAMDQPIVRAGLRGVDLVNNAQKAMLLYLKPAYLVPNMLGNVALNLAQQGFLAPFNMGKTLKVMFTGKGLTTRSVSGIKTAMGGGLTQVLEGDKRLGSLVTAGSNKLADWYGKVIDDPFRFSAFIHEARVDGFTTSKQIDSLFNPENETKLREISARANDAIINYERMGPGEQAIMRRLVFFYPWVKGSSRYGYQLAINHPVTAAATGVAGQTGTDFINSRLGGLPSYAEGLIPYGSKNGNPVVGNPASLAILQQPADLAKIVTNLFQHNPNPDLSAAQNLAPADAAALAFLTGGKESSISHPVSEPVYKVALNELFGGNPIKTLYENTTGGPPRPNSLYPDNSKLHAWLRFALTGGLTPRELNKSKANYVNYNQQHPTGYT